MADYQNVVKNGSFYHLYGAGTDNPMYRYIRPASDQQGKKKDNTIHPIQPVGAAPERTGMTAAPTVNSQLQFSQAKTFQAPQVNAGNPDPRDAGYFTDISKLDSYFQNRTADINAASAKAQADAQDVLASIGLSRTEANQSAEHANRDIAMALQTLAHNKVIDTRNQSNSSNKAGLLYSGFQQNALGDLNFNYGQKETGFANQKADVAQQLANQLSRLDLSEKGTKRDLATALAGYQRQLGELGANYGPNGFERQTALQDAIARALGRDQAAAANGAGQVPAGAAAPAPTQASGGYQNVTKNGKFYHVYNVGGKQVWRYIRPAS